MVVFVVVFFGGFCVHDIMRMGVAQYQCRRVVVAFVVVVCVVFFVVFVLGGVLLCIHACACASSIWHLAPIPFLSLVACE